MCTYVLIVNHSYIVQYKRHIISKRKVCLQDKIHIHNYVYFENTMAMNVEICDLNSYARDLIKYFSNRLK